MKILFAPAHYMLDGMAGGSEFSWGYHIIRSLAAYPGVHIIAITGVVKSPTPFPPNVRVIALDKGPILHLTWAYRLQFIFRTYIAARRVLKSEHIDVVHHILPFGLNSTFNLLPLLGTTCRAPFVIGPLQAPHTFKSDEEFIYSQGQYTKYTGFGDMLQDKLGSWVWRAARWVLRVLSSTTLRRSDALIAVNDETACLYAEAVPGIQPCVIPPGIDVEAFQDGSKNASTDLEIVTVGWLTKRKGVDLIIKAMAELKCTHPNVRLRIVGDGPQRQNLEALAKDLGVQDAVTFQGFVPNTEVVSFYRRAHIFVSMSFSESFGQTLVEAMAVGLCVVSAENVGARGIVRHGQTGFLVPSGQVRGLVDILRRLCDDPSLRAVVGSDGQRMAKEWFNWSSITAKYLDLYRSLRS